MVSGKTHRELHVHQTTLILRLEWSKRSKRLRTLLLSGVFHISSFLWLCWRRWRTGLFGIASCPDEKDAGTNVRSHSTKWFPLFARIIKTKSSLGSVLLRVRTDTKLVQRADVTGNLCCLFHRQYARMACQAHAVRISHLALFFGLKGTLLPSRSRPLYSLCWCSSQIPFAVVDEYKESTMPVSLMCHRPSLVALCSSSRSDPVQRAGKRGMKLLLAETRSLHTPFRHSSMLGLFQRKQGSR